MILLTVDFYKETGKWYSGGVIQVPIDFPTWDTDQIKEIVKEKQQCIYTESMKHFYCVVDCSQENIFCKRLFTLGELV